MKLISSLSLAAVVAAALQALPARAVDPDFGPNVLIFDPSMQNIQAQASAISAQQVDEGRAQFNNGRYALLFKPGNYGDLDIPVGFYMQVLGLGQTPDAVTFTGKGPHSSHYGNITQTFWRSVENFSVSNSSEYYWGVSQGADMRRVHVPGNKLSIFAGGWASGGFIADCKVNGQVGAGGQQQWFSRNSEFGNWGGGVWNVVFLGCPGMKSSWPKPPFTAVDKTPTMAEKPYLFVDPSGNYFVMVPSLRQNSAGTTWSAGPTAGTPIPISQFYLAHAGKDTAATINAALASGKNLILCPGIYHLENSINVTRPDTVVLGIGYANLIPDKGTPAMKIADVNGVKVGGILFEASTTNSPTLLQVGDAPSTISHAADPTILYDVFARVGGAGPGSSDVMVTINSNDVIGDNAWLWRADHGNGATWDGAKCKHALVVNGNNVFWYGLAVEHSQEEQTVWNGNGGQVYFYQSEMPYDVPAGGKGYPSYTVGNSVTTHQAWGVGIYSFNHNNCPTIYPNAIQTPAAPGIKFTHMVLFRGGPGGITNMINGVGPGNMKGNQPTMDVWSGGTPNPQ